MGIIRSIGKSFAGFFFITFLILSIILLTLTQLTDYTTSKPLFTDILSQQLGKSLNENELNQLHSALLVQCSMVNEVEFPLDGQKVFVKCSDIKSGTAKDLTKLVAKELFDNMYYKNYSCKFVECIQQGGQEASSVIFSAHANNFFKNIQTYLWIGTIVFGLIFLVAIETWSGRLKGFGTSLLFTSIPFFAFVYIKDLLIPKQLIQNLPIEAMGTVNNVINQIFTSMSNIFLVILIAGIILTVSGYVLAYKERKSKKKS